MKCFLVPVTSNATEIELSMDCCVGSQGVQSR
jgi:hypothetical protein